MSDIANDQFKIFYTEKLWSLIPDVYRYEDGLATNPNPNVLRALIEVIAEQAAILRRSQDRLWDDQFIELCDDWAIPYIGDLLGTRLLSPLNRRGQRIDVAKTIYYRRRKGTPRVLEELIKDISDWDGKLVEAFKRLARARHGLDPQPQMFAGMYTGTLPGGTADLRNATVSDLANGPFEEYFHTPDLRKPQGLDGQYGITKLDFYLYRLVAYPVPNVTPFSVGPGKYLFDPSGREIPLFSNSNRPVADEWEDWHTAFEWELPAPIRCQLLAHAVYLLQQQHIQQLIDNGLAGPVANQLVPFIGWKFRNEAELRTKINFLTPKYYTLLLRFTIIDACGKNQLLPASISVTAATPVNTVVKEHITAGSLFNWAPITHKRLVIDAEKGRFMFTATPSKAKNVVSTYSYGFSGPVGAGPYDRKEVEDSKPTVSLPASPATINLAALTGADIVEIGDNSTYQITSNPPDITNFTLQAANKKRPYVQLNTGGDLVFKSVIPDATLILDGLWLGSPATQQFDIVLRGDYKCVIIRNCTFDPGGTNVLSQAILPVRLNIEGTVQKLCIQQSIIGPVRTQHNGMIEDELIITDSIIQSNHPHVHAIICNSGKTSMIRTTVFGKVKAHILYASDTIITRHCTVSNNQTGCFRFSAAPANSVFPRPYQSYLFNGKIAYWFVSDQFGQPGFAQLSEIVPPEVDLGGENRAEMGAFNSLINAIKYDGLKAKIDEYMPFGLVPAYIDET